MLKNKGKITIRHVAEAAGVSVGTVSRVLNVRANVNPEIRRAVEKAIRDLDYKPNAVAQSMRSRSTHTIGCLLREISISTLAGFIRSAHDVLDQAGFSLLISNSEGRKEREIELLTRLARRQTDGIMIGPYTPIAGDFEDFLKRLNIPIVVIDRDKPDWADAVMANHAQGVRAATDHLLGVGHRRIAIITGDPVLSPARERIRGYQEAFEARGLTPDPSLVHAVSFLPEAGFRFTSAMLGQRSPPTAIIAGGIDMLPGVLKAIRARGLSIPNDISVIGSGHSELAELHTPSISSVVWDQGEIGRVAAGMLLDRVYKRGTDEPRRVLLPTEFVLRQSVAPPSPETCKSRSALLSGVSK